MSYLDIASDTRLAAIASGVRKATAALHRAGLDPFGGWTGGEIDAATELLGYYPAEPTEEEGASHADPRMP